MLKKCCGIILLDKLNTNDKFMWHLTENIDGGVIDANIIEFQKIKFEI